MTDLVIALIVIFVALSLASGLAVYAYGRFARRPLGSPSAALRPRGVSTVLDDTIGALLAGANGRSGLMLSDDNLQAFALRALSARAAGRSLDLQYYTWNDDLTGRLLAREVLAAADRRVRVRLLVDDINLRGRDAHYLALDRHPNIEVRVFNPSWNRVGTLQRGLELVLRAFSATRRMHNKAWIADGRLAIIGGRNIGDAYFDASEGTNFTDMDLLVVGPAVEQAEAIFDLFWNSHCVFPIDSFPWTWGGDLRALRSELEGISSSGKAVPYLARAHEEGTVDSILGARGRFHWCDRVEVVSDPPEKSTGEERNRWIHKAIFPIISSARQKLEITSPYFIPGKEGVRQLVELASRGVTVKVLTNSLAATDVAAVHGAYAPYRAPLIQGGVEIYELKREMQRPHLTLFGSKGASLHTKAFLVDKHRGFVGSFNFDPRSVSLNSEMGVIFDSESLARDVGSVFARQISAASSYRVVCRRGRLLWRDGSAEEMTLAASEPGAGLWRRFVASLIGLLPLEPQL